MTNFSENSIWLIQRKRTIRMQGKMVLRVEPIACGMNKSMAEELIRDLNAHDRDTVLKALEFIHEPLTPKDGDVYSLFQVFNFDSRQYHGNV
jgi:hypothetical protein